MSFQHKFEVIEKHKAIELETNRVFLMRLKSRYKNFFSKCLNYTLFSVSIYIYNSPGEFLRYFFNELYLKQIGDYIDESDKADFVEIRFKKETR